MKSKDITLPNGVKATLRALGPELMLRYQEKFPEPQPPMTQIARPDGSFELRHDTSDPFYKAEMSRHAQEMGVRFRELVIQRRLSFEWTDQMRAEVADARAEAKDLGISFPEDDKLVYVIYVAYEGDTKRTFDLLSQALEMAQVTDPKSQDGSGAST